MAQTAEAPAGAATPHLRDGSRLAHAQWYIGLLFAGSAAVLSVWARLPVPYRDDWVWLLWLLGDHSLAAYFIPHNEHVIPLTRLLLQLQYWLEGSNGYTMLVAALTSLGIVVWLTVREIARRWPEDARQRRWVGGVAVTLLCFAWQLQSMVFLSAVVFPLVQMFAVAATVCLLNAADATGRARGWWITSSVLCAAGALLTAANGLPVPVVLAVVAAGRRMGWKVVAGFGALAVLAAGLYLAFVRLGPASAAVPLDQVPPWWMVGSVFLAFYASLVAQVSALGGVLAGTVLFVAGLYAVYSTLVKSDRPRLEYFAAGILLFTMASAAMAAPNRANYGIVQVAQSRYATFVQPFWVALVLVAASRLAPARVQALAAPALVASVAALGAQALIGAVWVAKADNVATAGLALRSGGGDDEWVLTLYPTADLPRDVAAALVADGDTTLNGPLPALSVDAVAGAAVCDITARVTPVPVGAGYRLQAQAAVAAGTGVILDRLGTSVGLARPAPVADTPNPSPAEVARAVLQAIRAPKPERPAWIGFAGMGAGGPYALVILDVSGTPICRVHATGP